ncbi:hypothetical protein [Prescottella equi]|uniref:hypothetical protein n=1 Tax=Rhodococcus hoagii TaxID=43767 RepID=UPI001C76498F|nr:hypothetical protein [Prescottella equi]BCN82777.1 hypothetical protein RE0356_14180 [Prescottella equi]
MSSVTDAHATRIPSREEVLAGLKPDDGATTVFSVAQIGDPVPASDIHSVKPIRVSLERFDALDADGRPFPTMWSLAFIKTGMGDTEIRPDRIPELIAVLEGMHARYLAATRPVCRRNEDSVRAAAEIREDLS